MTQQILDYLKDTSKTSLDICSHFGLTIKETRQIMETLKRTGIVWERKHRTMGKRKVSRWGLIESDIQQEDQS